VQDQHAAEQARLYQDQYDRLAGMVNQVSNQAGNYAALGAPGPSVGTLGGSSAGVGSGGLANQLRGGVNRGL
jgi:hypothetical protein